MIYQITKGIKISVDTKYKGISHRASKIYHVFSYTGGAEGTGRVLPELQRVCNKARQEVVCAGFQKGLYCCCLVCITRINLQRL